MSRLPAVFTLLASLVFAGCAARTIQFPADPGSPLPDFSRVHADLARACTGVSTLTAELALSGRAGGRHLRGRVLAGFERPDSMRLEGVAPFGAPGFVVASRGAAATMLLPRDNRVLRGASADQILGGLTGVSLAPGDLLAILTGCVMPLPAAEAGRLHANGWASLHLKGDATLYLQRSASGWQSRAARRPGWQIEYAEWSGGFPRRVRMLSMLRGGAGSGGHDGTDVDLIAQISQLETNRAIAAAAFTVDVPETALPMTIEDLRASGPLRGAAVFTAPGPLPAEVTEVRFSE